MATAWVTGPRYSEQDRDNVKSQQQAFNLSDDDLADELSEPTEDTLALCPENLAAFYWFIEVDTDGFWQYTHGRRFGLDIQTILKDAEITGREFTPGDYKKLKLLGRFAISAELQAQASNHGE